MLVSMKWMDGWTDGVSSPLNVIILEQVIFSEYCVVLNYQITVPTVMKDQEHTQNQKRIKTVLPTG